MHDTALVTMLLHVGERSRWRMVMCGFIIHVITSYTHGKVSFLFFS